MQVSKRHLLWNKTTLQFKKYTFRLNLFMGTGYFDSSSLALFL